MYLLNYYNFYILSIYIKLGLIIRIIHFIIYYILLYVNYINGNLYLYLYLYPFLLDFVYNIICGTDYIYYCINIYVLFVYYNYANCIFSYFQDIILFGNLLVYLFI